MHLSRFGEKLTTRSGILQLMEDLGKALACPGSTYMLGGGNPAHLDEINRIWRSRMAEILASGNEFVHMVADYDAPKGEHRFLEAVAALLRREYGFDIGPENVAITNGSQSAFFYLFNMFAGPRSDGEMQKVLFPVIPEYVGYADQGIFEGMFAGSIPSIETSSPHAFKYRVDFDTLHVDESVSLMCVSRPTNPTGNVLSNGEMARLSEIAKNRDIPLLVDNAYGLPFPGIVFTDATPVWDRHVVLSMSLSKLGLPAVRTGIIVADEQIIEALSAANAIGSLANGSLGPVLTLPMFVDGSILTLSREVIGPFYKQRSVQARNWIEEYFGDDIDYAVHLSEGAIFLWIWFRDLKVTSRELYERLKDRGVIVVPGEYFFFGIDDDWQHSRQCIRVNYSGSESAVQQGIRIIADEARRLSR